MNEENEKYPQLIIHPNGTYNLLIAKGVQTHFVNGTSIKEFIKNKNILIKEGYGKKHPKDCLNRIIEF